MTRTVYYVAPTAQTSSSLRSIIDKFAEPCEGPSFSPHVSFYTGEIFEHENAGELLRLTIEGIGPFWLKPLSIEFDDTFTRSFYLTFEPAKVLNDLSDRLRAATALPNDYQVRLHLSLAYTSVPIYQRRSLAECIPPLQERVYFDCCGALESLSIVKSATDVKSWKNIASFPVADNR